MFQYKPEYTYLILMAHNSRQIYPTPFNAHPYPPAITTRLEFRENNGIN